MTDEDLKKGCALACAYNTAPVCIKPSAIGLAVDALEVSEIIR